MNHTQVYIYIYIYIYGMVNQYWNTQEDHFFGSIQNCWVSRNTIHLLVFCILTLRSSDERFKRVPYCSFVPNSYCCMLLYGLEIAASTNCFRAASTNCFRSTAVCLALSNLPPSLSLHFPPSLSFSPVAAFKVLQLYAFCFCCCDAHVPVVRVSCFCVSWW